MPTFRINGQIVSEGEYYQNRQKLQNARKTYTRMGIGLDRIRESGSIQNVLARREQNDLEQTKKSQEQDRTKRNLIREGEGYKAYGFASQADLNYWANKQPEPSQMKYEWVNKDGSLVGVNPIWGPAGCRTPLSGAKLIPTGEYFINTDAAKISMAKSAVDEIANYSGTKTQTFSYTAQTVSSAIKTPSSSYSAPINLSRTQTQNYSQQTPTTNYGTTPPPINPALKITNTLIYQGSSTMGNDTILGQGYMNGHEGNDQIIGSAGNDLIYGGSGNDVITSGGGTDYIYGEGGDDIINLKNTSGISYADGGAGFDKFILSSGNGYAKILNYNPKEDQVDASQCGVGGLRLGSSGSIEILSKNSNTIALLEGSGYSLTGNLKTDCKNLGIVG